MLDIERCLLQSDTMNTLLDELRARSARAALSVWDQQTERGLLRFLTLREGRRTRQAMVNVVASAPDVATLMPVAEALRERVPATASVVLNVNAKKASVAVGSEEHLLLGRDHIRESLSGVHFQVSANSFFQTNTVQAERLFALVAEACALDGHRDGHGPLLGHRRHQPAAGAARPRACTASSWPRPRWPTRCRNARGQRHRQLHVPRRRGPPRAARR